MSNKQTSLKSKKVTIMPKVAMLINQCKSKGQNYRIIIKDEEVEDIKETTRMTIVIDTVGNYIKNYYG